MNVQLKVVFIWMSVIYTTETSKRTIRSHKCKYTFVVNELDATNCPTSLPQIQADKDAPERLLGLRTSSTPNLHPFQTQGSSLPDTPVSEKTASLLSDMDKQLIGEMRRVQEMNTTLAKQEAALSKAQEQLGTYQANFSAIFRMLHYLEQSVRDQKETSRNLDNKLSGIMLDVVEVNNVLSKKVPAVDGKLRDKEIKVQSVSKVNSCTVSPDAVTYRDCADVQKRHTKTGIYYVTPTYASCAIPVWCDMDTPLGGWLLLLRRQNGELDFNRLWNAYKHGFGNVMSEFYLGNDNIFLLTNQAHYELRVDLWDFEGNRVFALYKQFKVEGERDNYKMHVHAFEGSARDAMVKHNGAMFSTADNDHDAWPNYNCAREWEAGWWFSNCWYGFLTGPYYNISKVRYRGISWNEWKHEQLAHVEMKIRPSRLVKPSNTTGRP